METFAEYILSEKDFFKKLEIMLYYKKNNNIFFDNSVIYKALIAKLFIEVMDIEIDKNLVITAMLLCQCKKMNNSQDIDRLKRYSKESADFLKTLGFSDEFCLICEQHNRYSNSSPRKKESDILELANQFGGMLIDRPDRVAIPIEEAIVLLEYRNLKGYKNIYINKFKEFVNIAKEVNIK